MTQAQKLNFSLAVAAAQLSSAGIKPANEDAVGIRIPEEPLLSSKGVALVVADGVSSAEAGRQASEIAVQGFLTDFYATPDSWSVKTSGERVLSSLNRWLHGMGQQYNLAHQGFLTTFTALVLRSRSAHIFHVGDTRVYRLRGDELELLTKDHAMRVNADTTYLTRALGMDWIVEIDYLATGIEAGDLFLTTSDGVHGFLPRARLLDLLRDDTLTLDERCELIQQQARERGSNDNLSCQLLHITALPPVSAEDSRLAVSQLPMTPDLHAGQVLDGLLIEAEIHASPRSHVYRVRDTENDCIYVLKAPSRHFEDDTACRAQFAVEEWIGCRIDNAHVVKTINRNRPRQCLYLVQEYLQGQTLRQWMQKNPAPPAQLVTAFAAQIIKGLRALHRRDTLHQDIKPDNIFLCTDGTLKLIDLGSAQVGGLQEKVAALPPGALEYAAPEYVLGQAHDTRAEQFSLAVTLYELLTGHLPYGEHYAEARSVPEFARLGYTSACRYNPHVPLWLDAALNKALSINPGSRYDALGELMIDLDRPNPAFNPDSRRPWLERNPLRFWQVLAGLLALGNVVLLFWLLKR